METLLQHRCVMKKSCFAWQGLGLMADDFSTALGGPEKIVGHQSRWDELAVAKYPLRLARNTGQGWGLQELVWSWDEALW